MSERKGFPEHLLTVEVLRELGFPVKVVEKTLGGFVTVHEGSSWGDAVGAAKRARVVHWSTCAEWAETVEARKAKHRAQASLRLDTEVHAWLTRGATGARLASGDLTLGA